MPDVRLAPLDLPPQVLLNRLRMLVGQHAVPTRVSVNLHAIQCHAAKIVQPHLARHEL